MGSRPEALTKSSHGCYLGLLLVCFLFVFFCFLFVFFCFLFVFFYL